jgi:NADH-quinone oxidoreductase subunit M
MMDSSAYPVLTVLTFWPTVAAILLALTKSERATRGWTLFASLVEIVLAWPLIGFQKVSDFQFVEILQWAPQWGLTYSLGLDGVSVLMVWLSILTLPICVLCSWTYIGRRVKEFHVCLLLMTTACVGVFSALDLVLFYVFWEALLIPMYLMIAIWGGDERRYASIKFFLYTLAGSTLLLVAIVALRIEGGTFFIPDLMTTHFPYNFQYWIFLAFFLAFAIKVPMFPFHTWLPAAHVQAPAAGSVILAAVLLKMGTYGFLRFSLPMAPAASAHFAPMMIILSVASILYGGAIALGQSDIKKLIAYSSVAHMGFVTLGIFVFSVHGFQGALFQMLNHGIITGAMFTLIGAIYERSHSREISRNLGLGQRLPAFMFFWGLFGLGSFGFPGTNGFVGEFLVIAAAFENNITLGLCVIPGALLAAAYILKVTLKMAWGQPASPGPNWKDLKKKEWAYLIIPAFLVIYLGLVPAKVLDIITPSVESSLASFHNDKNLTKTEPTFTEENLAPGPESAANSQELAPANPNYVFVHLNLTEEAELANIAESDILETQERIELDLGQCLALSPASPLLSPGQKIVICPDWSVRVERVVMIPAGVIEEKNASANPAQANQTQDKQTQDKQAQASPRPASPDSDRQTILYESQALRDLMSQFFRLLATDSGPQEATLCRKLTQGGPNNWPTVVCRRSPAKGWPSQPVPAGDLANPTPAAPNPGASGPSDSVDPNLRGEATTGDNVETPPPTDPPRPLSSLGQPPTPLARAQSYPFMADARHLTAATTDRELVWAKETTHE